MKNALCAVFAALALLVPAAHAATYLVPTDAEMIQQADDIVVATALSSESAYGEGGDIVTRTTLRIEDSLKGDLTRGQQLVLTEMGGALGGKFEAVPGAPAYLHGQRYLIFTTVNVRGERSTYGMALGQFFLIDDVALRYGVDGFDRNLEPFTDRMRDAKAFVAYIRAVVAQRNVRLPRYFTTRPLQPATQWKVASLFTRNSYLVTTSGGSCPACAFRWQTPSYTFVEAGTAQGANGPSSASHAIGEWNATGTSISITDGGVDGTATGGLVEDGKNTILFNDPHDEVPSAFLGYTKIFGDITYDLPGEPTHFINIFEADVVMDDQTFSQCLLDAATTHEVGHSLGFRHSNENQTYTGPCPAGLDCTSDAVMNSSVGCGNQESLRQWDQDAANTVYGSGPVCNPPSISPQPQSKSVSLGSSATLTVTATGTAPLTYQWYIGNSGDTSTTTGTSSSTLNLNTNTAGVTNYWVKVSNSCGNANSNTATVTVTCDPPAITGNPNGASIIEGNSAQLTVNATGSLLSYQWYTGNSGNTSSPIANSNNKTISVSPTQTTNYWVRVSGQCGSPVDSAAATVTVALCDDVTVDAPTATPNGGAGKFTLHVNAFSPSMPLLFTWFKGTTPGFGGQQAGSGQTLNVTVTAVTSYWVRVTNGCGKVAFSPLITVAPCTLPSITTQPADQNVSQGASAILTIVHTGTSVKWFRGLVGDMTTQVGTGNSFNTGPLTTNTSYWAQVTNACGSVSSRQVVVSVQALSDILHLLNGRFTVQVRYRNQFENPPVEGILKGRSLFSSPISETAIFTFGDPLVVELMVRVSDARPFANRIDLFYGAISDVEFFIDVTDTLTGISKSYHKPPFELTGEVDRVSFPATPSPGLQDGIDALVAQTVTRGITPSTDSNTIRLLNNRYEVRMHYRNQFENPAVEGYLLARSIASSPTTETAVFYFNTPESVEWLVRFSDARPFATRIDLFHGGLSDVEFTIEVTDTVTGQHKEYHKDPFSLSGLVDRTSYVP